MKIIYRRSKDYICNVCEKEFNWNKESSYYGKLEYKFNTEWEKVPFFVLSMRNPPCA